MQICLRLVQSIGVWPPVGSGCAGMAGSWSSRTAAGAVLSNSHAGRHDVLVLIRRPAFLVYSHVMVSSKSYKVLD
jgi:hypothetical protein